MLVDGPGIKASVDLRRGRRREWGYSDCRTNQRPAPHQRPARLLSSHERHSKNPFQGWLSLQHYLLFCLWLRALVRLVFAFRYSWGYLPDSTLRILPSTSTLPSLIEWPLDLEFQSKVCFTLAKMSGRSNTS